MYLISTGQLYVEQLLRDSLTWLPRCRMTGRRAHDNSRATTEPGLLKVAQSKLVLYVLQCGSRHNLRWSIFGWTTLVLFPTYSWWPRFLQEKFIILLWYYFMLRDHNLVGSWRTCAYNKAAALLTTHPGTVVQSWPAARHLCCRLKQVDTVKVRGGAWEPR